MYYSEYPFVREAVAAGTRGTHNRTGVSFNRGHGALWAQKSWRSLGSATAHDAADVMFAYSALTALQNDTTKVGATRWALNVHEKRETICFRNARSDCFGESARNTIVSAPEPSSESLSIE